MYSVQGIHAILTADFIVFVLCFSKFMKQFRDNNSNNAEIKPNCKNGINNSH